MASGADLIAGGSGADRVRYGDQAGAGVRVTLDGAADDGQPGEADNVLPDVENVTGTRFADTLVGSALANEADEENESIPIVTPELRAASLGDHVDRLYRAAWAMCGSREDAEDLVQETFARVLAKPRQTHSDDPLPYLLRVLRNTFISTLRARSRRPQTDPLEDDEPRAVAPASSSPSALLAAREVFAAIAGLTENYRDVLVAVDVAGLSYEEAAAAFEIPLGTVMSRLYRARGKVAEALGD